MGRESVSKRRTGSRRTRDSCARGAPATVSQEGKMNKTTFPYKNLLAVFALGTAAAALHNDTHTGLSALFEHAVLVGLGTAITTAAARIAIRYRSRNARRIMTPLTRK